MGLGEITRCVREGRDADGKGAKKQDGGTGVKRGKTKVMKID